MWFVPSDILFGQFGYGPGKGQPTQIRGSQLWLEILHVLEFSQTNCFYRLIEKSIKVNVGKLWFEFHIDISSFFVCVDKKFVCCTSQTLTKDLEIFY